MLERGEGANEWALRLPQTVDDDLVLWVALGERGPVLLSVHDDEDLVCSSFAGIHDVEHQGFACHCG
jgi:hypothetical protein